MENNLTKEQLMKLTSQLGGKIDSIITAAESVVREGLLGAKAVEEKR